MEKSINLSTIFSAAVLVSVFVLAATYSGCDLTMVGISFIVAVGALGIISASLILNPMDLTSNYAGTLSGIMGTFGCLMGIVVPIAVSQMTPNVCYYHLPHLRWIIQFLLSFQALQSEWRVVFWVTAAFQIAQLVIFACFGSAKVQPWNSPQDADAQKGKMPMTETKVTTRPTNINSVAKTDGKEEINDNEKKPAGQG